MDLREIARFPSRLEAEAVGHALDPHGIPFLVRADDVGMFGPGMTGWSPQGAALLVPAEHEAEVRRLLSCFADGAEAAILGEREDDGSADDG